MENIPGFEVLDIVSESEGFRVLRARRERDRHLLLIRRAKDINSREQVKDRLKWEYQVLETLKLSGVPAAEGLLELEGEQLLLIEHFDGIAWDRLKRPSADLDTFFELAIATATVIGELHAKSLIHKSISPANILVAAGRGEVRLIGFGYASRLSRAFSDFLEGDQVDDLGYIAPEQIGRLNSDVDFRVDWYALGAVLYRVLSGHRPFPGKGSHETIYAQLARTPRSLHLLEPEVPEMLSALVAKLMAKQPEERYQGQHGLIADLRECWRQWREHRAIAPFELGRKDVSSGFAIPRKLYGRKRETERLLRTFEEVAAGGHALGLVSGLAGSGKSSLVWELHRPVAAKQGLFLAGKFEQYNRRMPYSATITAFKGAVRQILASGNEQIARWRDKILRATGPNGKLLVDVLPELALLIGERPDVPILPPTESQHRFNALFVGFIRLFANEEHPLLLFLDDLQWADSASLGLLEAIMLDPETHHLMLVGSYRDNELDYGHPLVEVLERLRKPDLHRVELNVGPLTPDSVADLLAGAFGTSASQVADLALVCHRKTDGNPFFLRQFLEAIHFRKLIYFQASTGVWKWSIKEIDQAQITENVAELMSSQIERLPFETFTLLKLAACIGSQFDLATLSMVSGMGLLETRDALWPALKDGLIRPRNDRYQFISNARDASLVFFHFPHDRIQQAAYALIQPERLARTHLELGRALLDCLNEAECDRRLFEIVNHFMVGVSLIGTRAERFRLANLLLRAGIRAKESSVFKLAHEYLESALTLVTDEDWSTRYAFMRDLHLEAAETCYIFHRLEQMEALLEALLERAVDPDERRRAFEIRLNGYVGAYNWSRAFRAGLDGLKDLGLEFPEQLDAESCRQALAEAAAAMDAVGLDNLAALPAMTDQLRLSQIRLLAAAMTPIFHVAPDLFRLMTARYATLTLAGGHMELSGYLWSTYAMVVVVEEPERALALGRLAIELAGRYPSGKVHGRTVFTVHANLSFRTRPITDLVALLHDSYTRLVESGDIEFAAYALVYHLMFAFFSGARPLVELSQLCQRWIRVLERLVIGYPLGLLCAQAVQDLSASQAGGTVLRGRIFDHGNCEAKGYRLDRFSEGQTLIFELMLAYLLGDRALAWQAAERCRELGLANTHEYTTSIYLGFASLVRLERWSATPEQERPALLALVEADQTRLAQWARMAPANFAARWHLVEAQRALLEERHPTVQHHFDKALALVSGKVNHWERALVNEACGRYWFACDNLTLAGIFLRRAAKAWSAWGADAKCAALQREFSDLLECPADEVIEPQNRLGAQVDLSELTEACADISNACRPTELLEHLARVTMEHAGAQYCALLLDRQGQWLLMASGDPDGVRTLDDRPTALERCDTLSRGICHYAANTGQIVLLEDAAESTNWDSDPYILGKAPKSLLCQPISLRGKVRLLLYLENNLRRSVFTEDHLRVLGMFGNHAVLALAAMDFFVQDAEPAQSAPHTPKKETSSEPRNRPS